jgi:hypothetical protein
VFVRDADRIVLPQATDLALRGFDHVLLDFARTEAGLERAQRGPQRLASIAAKLRREVRFSQSIELARRPFRRRYGFHAQQSIQVADRGNSALPVANVNTYVRGNLPRD